MAELFDCPACGASLDADHDNDGLVRCTHCGKNVVVPESLRRRHEPQTRVDVQVMAIGAQETWQPARRQGLNRAITCFVAVVILLVIATTIVSIAAPLVVTGLALEVFGENAPFLQGLLTEAEDNPQVIFTLPAVSTTVPATPTPGFAQMALAFGSEGTGPGRFDDTRSVAVDADGFIYTAEYSDRRIQKFRSDGTYVHGWSAGGSNAVLSLAVNRSGIVYVVTTGDVLKYDTEGNYLGELANPSDDYFQWVSITADNGLLVSSDDTIYRYGANEDLLFQIDHPYQTASDNGRIVGRPAIDGLGAIYVPVQFVQQGKFKTQVFVFTAGGEYTNRFGSDGDDPGQFRALQTLAVDGAGRIYVSDFKGIQIFYPDGAYLNRIDVEGVPFGLWFDDSGSLYVASSADKIVKFELTQ